MEDEQSKRTIIYSTSGLISLVTGLLLSLINTSFGVHSGEILIWTLFLFIVIVIIPTVLFIKSILSISKLEPEKTKIRLYSITLTSMLGVGLTITIVAALIFINK